MTPTYIKRNYPHYKKLKKDLCDYLVSQSGTEQCKYIILETKYNHTQTFEKFEEHKRSIKSASSVNLQWELGSIWKLDTANPENKIK